MAVRISKRKVDEYLLDRGWKVTDLAERAGLSWSTIYRALDGKEFNSGTLEKMAIAFGLNPLDLLEVDGPPPLVVAQAAYSMAA